MSRWTEVDRQGADSLLEYSTKDSLATYFRCAKLQYVRGIWSDTCYIKNYSPNVQSIKQASGYLGSLNPFMKPPPFSDL